MRSQSKPKCPSLSNYWVLLFGIFVVGPSPITPHPICVLESQTPAMASLCPCRRLAAFQSLAPHAHCLNFKSTSHLAHQKAFKVFHLWKLVNILIEHWPSPHLTVLLMLSIGLRSWHPRKLSPANSIKIQLISRTAPMVLPPKVPTKTYKSFPGIPPMRFLPTSNSLSWLWP